MVKDCATSWLRFVPCVFYWAAPNAIDVATSWLVYENALSHWATPNADDCATSWLKKRIRKNEISKTLRSRTFNYNTGIQFY